MSKPITTTTVKHVAKLATIPISENEAVALTDAFEQTLKVVDKLKAVDVTNVESTHQVTGLTNVWREDEIDNQVMFTQTQALANAAKQHNGYFVVNRIIEEKE